MKFNNIYGISDSIEIINSWLDIRNVLLVMPASKIIEQKRTFKVDYYNPDQIVSKNFFLLRRLMDNINDKPQSSQFDKNQIIKFDIYKSLETIFNKSVKKGSMGSKKISKNFGSWKTPTRNKVYYTYTAFFEKEGSNLANEISKYIVNEKKEINSVRDLIKITKFVLSNKNREILGHKKINDFFL